MLFLGILSIQCKIRRDRRVGHLWCNVYAM